MRRLIFSTAILLLLCAAAVGVALFIGRQQPTPTRITALHLTDCLPPCWIGIVPGKTTIGEARQRIAAAFTQSPEYGFRLTESAPYTVSGFLYDRTNSVLTIQIGLLAYVNNGDKSIVNEIEVVFPPRLSPAASSLSPLVADFQYLLGTPSRLLAFSTANEDSLNYGDDTQGVNVSAVPFDWDEPISELLFYDFTEPGQRLTYILANTWNGMSPARRYWTPCYATSIGSC